ncbi:MAG: DUF4783 domain-containing protein [Bacteroidetes bacterium]|nr:DUF4783 domain-containing protein [Bacteroidota bacterium]
MLAIKKITFAIFLVSGLILSSFNSNAQIPSEIILSLETGNSKILSDYFNQNVELVVLDNDNVYSKAQAKQIVNNFFNSHTPEPKGFSILHQGGKEGAKYVIGNLITNNGSFRVYFLLKKDGGKEYIHQLRIEKK